MIHWMPWGLQGGFQLWTLKMATGKYKFNLKTMKRLVTKGLFEFNVLAFGLCNTPGTFQRLMELVLSDCSGLLASSIWMTLLFFGLTFEEHLTRLRQVLKKLQEAQLKVKPSKCCLFADQVKHLGHVISRNNIATDPDKIEAVKSWPIPKNSTEVRICVGLASYY